jgi:hypothetical protein
MRSGTPETGTSLDLLRCINQRCQKAAERRELPLLGCGRQVNADRLASPRGYAQLNVVNSVAAQRTRMPQNSTIHYRCASQAGDGIVNK